MAKNDKVLIDGIIDERVEQSLPSKERGEAFEYFSFEQILKDYDLSHEEITLGSVDGRNDAGIDGFYIFVNGHYLTDPENFNWPKSGSVLEVWLITCKHQDTFRQAPLDNLAASMVELLDFSIEGKDLKGEYSNKVLRYRENLKLAYRKVSPRLSKFSINFCYASRGNTDEVGDSIIARSEQIKNIALESFGTLTSTFEFYGASELIDLHRKSRNFSLELPFIDDLSSGETYIVLVNLRKYFEFIQDEGKLRRYLFDSNIRDFMGLNRVNEDIRDTLLDTKSPDFWWLNNGVTILSTFANIVGSSILIQDIQIVNGLQTSESIYRHFINGGDDPENRSVLVKVIVSKDETVRDTIIRATNNQTTVELAALHATDKIQRDIEDILKQHEYYYERRTNYYKNQGITSDRIIAPLYLASGFVNLINKSPLQATKLRSKFMRSLESYEKVFSVDTDLNVWPKIAEVLKKTDQFLEKMRPVGPGGSEHFLKNRRQMLAFLTISRLMGTFNFSINDFVNFNMSKFSQDELKTVWMFLSEPSSEVPNRKKISATAYNEIIIEAGNRWGIKGIGRFKPNVTKKEVKPFKERFKKMFDKKKLLVEGVNNELDYGFIQRVKELLPRQPWKPGIDKTIIEELGCTRGDYFDAVKVLIENGDFFRQRDGVVFDENGDVLFFDEDRVDGETMKLK